jgi:hypothetical protein
VKELAGNISIEDAAHSRLPRDPAPDSTASLKAVGFGFLSSLKAVGFGFLSSFKAVGFGFLSSFKAVGFEFLSSPIVPSLVGWYLCLLSWAGAVQGLTLL